MTWFVIAYLLIGAVRTAYLYALARPTIGRTDIVTETISFGMMTVGWPWMMISARRLP